MLAMASSDPTFRVRSMRPKYVSSSKFRANPPALTADAGYTTELSRPSQAFSELADPSASRTGIVHSGKTLDMVAFSKAVGAVFHRDS